MPRPAKGTITTKQTTAGLVYAIRFRAYGSRRYVRLGTAEEGWTQKRAEQSLRHVLADVERGIWRPAPTTAPPPREIPTFHRFASDWLERKEPELRPKTVQNYRWALRYHLLPHFADLLLTEITAEEVDRYKADRLREGRIAPNQINTTLTRLAQILDQAVKYDLIQRNPAHRARVKGTRPRRLWVEPEQLPTLLTVASDQHRPLVATMAGAGLRVGEAVSLDWRDVNLAVGTLTVHASKTEAGTDRTVDLPVGLRAELKAHRMRVGRERGANSAPVFTTRSGGRQAVGNVGRRLKTIIRRANTRLEELGIEPISERVSLHGLRRTYASLRACLRDDPVYIAKQLGHEDAAFSLTIYSQAVKRRERLTGNYLAEFDKAVEWALLGTSAEMAPYSVGSLPVDERANMALTSQNSPPAPIAQLDRATPS